MTGSEVCGGIGAAGAALRALKRAPTGRGNGSFESIGTCRPRWACRCF